MKIGIMGTHCAGKTTLAKALSRELNLPLVAEVAAKVPKEKRSSIGTQIDIMFNQVKSELPYAQFVSDRTVYDNWAYYDYWAKSKGSTPILDMNVWTFVDSYMAKKHYTWVFFVDEYFDPVDNGVRDTDPEPQVYVFDTLKERYKDMKRCEMNVKTVRGTTEQRIGQILGYIGGQ